jgi:hypothetical protein
VPSSARRFFWPPLPLLVRMHRKVPTLPAAKENSRREPAGGDRLAPTFLPYPRINSRLTPWRRIIEQSPLRLRGITVTESVALRLFEGSIMPQSQCLSSVIPFAAIGPPGPCPKCKAR